MDARQRKTPSRKDDPASAGSGAIEERGAEFIGCGELPRIIPPHDGRIHRLVLFGTAAAGIFKRVIFRRVNRIGRVWRPGITPQSRLAVVKGAAKRSGIQDLAPHDLRRTCARLCHLAGGELEQIQILLGHASVQTTERYLGCKQKLRHAVNDKMGIDFT